MYVLCGLIVYGPDFNSQLGPEVVPSLFAAAPPKLVRVKFSRTRFNDRILFNFSAWPRDDFESIRGSSPEPGTRKVLSNPFQRLNIFSY
jgi:hypothetical protein